MKICGIICEYNPFHNGHFLHIQKTRELLGVDTAIVCCMSGNYVQRGEPAILNKHLRTRAALCSGADLVIELPSAYSLLSAEGFAFSGVYLLNALGIVTDISFGAETDDINSLSKIAVLLSEHDTVKQTLLEMKSGISYAAAREKALYTAIKDQASLLSRPNNILATEYIKALNKLSSGIVPHSINRVGAEHDSERASQGTLSASAIRNAVLGRSLHEVEAYISKESYEMLNDGEGLSTAERREMFYHSMYTYLLRLSAEDFLCYPDVSEGLEYRIYNALHSSLSVDEALNKAKTKRYPLARIRRIMLRAYLGLSSSFSDEPPPYCRVLGFNQTGQKLLNMMRTSASVPIITKAGHISKLPANAQELFNSESLCTDLYNASSSRKNAPGSEWRQQAVIY